MKQVDWEILGLRLALNQKRELFFFDILKPRNVAFFVKFSKNECNMISKQNWAENCKKVAWPSGLGVGRKM